MPVEQRSGLYRGVVVDADDPEGLFRLRVQVPQLFGGAITDWAWPSIPLTPGVATPNQGDNVWVTFEAGDPERPVWVGIWRTYRTGGADPDALFGGVVSETTYGLTPSNGIAETVSRSDHTHGSPPAEMPPHLAASDPHPQYATDTDVATTNANLATETAARIAGDATKIGVTKLYVIRTYARATFR